MVRSFNPISQLEVQIAYRTTLNLKHEHTITSSNTSRALCVKFNSMKIFFYSVWVLLHLCQGQLTPVPRQGGDDSEALAQQTKWIGLKQMIANGVHSVVSFPLDFTQSAFQDNPYMLAEILYRGIDSWKVVLILASAEINRRLVEWLNKSHKGNTLIGRALSYLQELRNHRPILFYLFTKLALNLMIERLTFPDIAKREGGLFFNTQVLNWAKAKVG